MVTDRQTRLLIVDRDEPHARAIEQELVSEPPGFEVRVAADLPGALQQLTAGRIDVILLDPRLPDYRDLEALRMIVTQQPDVPVVVMSEGVEEIATRAMRLGAQDCVVKSNMSGKTLARTIRHALERKFAGAALRESEQRFRSVFEEGPVGMALVNPDLRIVRANAALCELVGYPADELAGLTFADLVHPHDIEQATWIATRTIRDGGVLRQVEVQLVRKNKALVWGAVSGSIVRGHDASRLYGVLIVEDVTERKRAEEAVRESHTLLHAVIGNTTDAVYVKDCEGRYLLLNGAAAEMVGRRAADAVGKTDHELFPAKTAQKVVETDLAIMAGGVTETFEEQLFVGRELRTYLTTKGVYRDDQGQVIGLFGVGRDITERKQGEERLRRSEERYRGLVEHATYGIYRSTVDGRFQSVNPALVEMLGYGSDAEMLALDMARDVYKDVSQRQRLVQKFEREDRIEPIEVEWKRKDGRPIVVRLSGRPLHENNGALAGFEMIAEDVTDRRTLESQLRQAQKMEAVGELTGGIAHDLNNILTVISANVDLIGEALPPSDEEVAADVAETRAAARRGTALIKKLLGFSRRSRLEVKPIDVAALVREVSGMLERVVPESIDFQLVLHKGSGVVRADPAAVEQILVNLVTNARDAMPEGGVLTVEVERAMLDANYRAAHPWAKIEDCVCITVRDSGAGMNLETQERIFEPFFTTKPLGIGTGLGMAMVYGLVKQHDGVIDVHSQVGEGTGVKVYLPRVEERVSPIPSAPATWDHQGGTETILVVEDEEPIRRAAKRVLEKHGYRVILAVDGEQALATYRRYHERIDLVVSDVVMPKLGGMKFYEALQQLGGHPPKILFTSGYSARDVRDTLSIDATLPFLHKPWTVTELLGKVREVLEQESPPAHVT